MGTATLLESFEFKPGRILAGKYEIIACLGTGWEGEVYHVRECVTQIERAAKFFFPHRNPQNKTLRSYAKKLHKLRHCPMIIQYSTQDSLVFKKMPITFLVSEYVEGELLKKFIERQPGRRLQAFQALHLLHALTEGLEVVHNSGEYHGDLHAENIIVRRYGLGFDIKLVDLYHWKAPKRENMRDDVCDLVRIFYDALGGKRLYAQQSSEVKGICCGLKRSLILKRFPRMGALKTHLETMEWE